MPIHGYPGNVITANPTAPTSSVATGVWTTEQQLQAVSQGNWPGYEYPISRSLRFNSADSAYLNRTPASASNRKTWTWSGWVKKSDVVGSTPNQLFVARTGSDATYTLFYFDGSPDANSIKFLDNGATLISSSKYRDSSAWYHVVIALDTTQATSSDRVKIYVNGVQVTAFSTATYPSQNADLNVNSTATHLIGQQASGQYFNGYLTEINFIDGQALTPSSFGLNDPETGVWSPKRYTGTYGTNGFYLNFSDNSGTTSTTLGKDSSGNGNNWTPNNFSVTAGAGNDSLVDTPTSYGTDTGVGGEVRGNYCTWNPTLPPDTFSQATNVLNGNLQVKGYNVSFNTWAVGTMPVSSGKWYFEFLSENASDWQRIGIILSTTNRVNPQDGTYYQYYSLNGNKLANGVDTAYGNSWTTNDVIGVALDLDNGKLWFSKNGTYQASGDPVAGTNAAFTGLSGSFLPAASMGSATSNSAYANFGQRPFAYTAPSGFKALCTQNLPTPTIGATSTTQANDYFNAVLYTGDGANPRTVSGVGFQPDFVWTKSRSSAFDHWLFDAVRGATKTLTSNSTSAEITYANSLKSFISDGFTVGDLSDINANGGSYVAWNWKANGAGSSNTAGTITSTVSANTTSGFSIVTYTGNGSAGSTVGHGLGASPSWIITKSRSNATNWMVWTDKLTTNYALEGLNTTGAEVSGGSPSKYIRAVSSTTFTIGDDISVNQSASYTYVAYCFAPVAGYSAFGSYTGNGSADGPFVYTGFRPAFVLVKYSSTTSYWIVFDNKRNTYNLTNNGLQPNDSAAENSNLFFVDFLSNGFKARDGGGLNGSGQTAIYAAFAESPFKYSLAR